MDAATVSLTPVPGGKQEPRPPATGLDDLRSVAVVGLGYVGLPTAIALAESGVEVTGIDVSPERLTAIRAGDVDLLPDDHRRLERSLAAGNLSTTAEVKAVAFADAVVVCVPTPVDEHLVPDLTAIRSACEAVVDAVRPGTTVVLTSTTYVGTTRDLLVTPLEERGLVPGRGVYVAFSPERIDPGNADHAHTAVPRVVGGVTTECTVRAVRLIERATTHVHAVQSPEAAEMTKLYENAFRAVNIALANEIADVCGTLDLDVMEVIEAASTKPYGFMPFYPGPGVGGHCIPCDPHYLTWQLRPLRRSAPVIETAMSGIADRPARVVERAAEVLAAEGRSLRDAHVLLVGVSYKPGVADVRESPGLDILAGLRRHGARVDYHDPLVPTITCRAGDPYVSVGRPRFADYDLVVVHTVHPGREPEGLEEARLVLDATYRFHGGLARAVV